MLLDDGSTSVRSGKFNVLLTETRNVSRNTAFNKFSFSFSRKKCYLFDFTRSNVTKIFPAFYRSRTFRRRMNIFLFQSVNGDVWRSSNRRIIIRIFLFKIRFNFIGFICFRSSEYDFFEIFDLNQIFIDHY